MKATGLFISTFNSSSVIVDKIFSSHIWVDARVGLPLTKRSEMTGQRLFTLSSCTRRIFTIVPCMGDVLDKIVTKFRAIFA